MKVPHFSTSLFLKTLDKLDCAPGNSYGVAVSLCPTSMALLVLLRHHFPSSKAYAVYVPSNNSEKDHIPQIKDCAGILGVDIDIVYPKDKDSGLSASSREGYLRGYMLKNLTNSRNDCILEYMIKRGIKNVMFGGDLNDFLGSAIRDIIIQQRQDLYYGGLVKEVYPSISPLRSFMRKVKPLVYFERDSIMSTCSNLGYNIPREDLKHGNKSDSALLNKYLKAGNFTKGRKLDMEYMTSMVEKFHRCSKELEESRKKYMNFASIKNNRYNSVYFKVQKIDNRNKKTVIYATSKKNPEKGGLIQNENNKSYILSQVPEINGLKHFHAYVLQGVAESVSPFQGKILKALEDRHLLRDALSARRKSFKGNLLQGGTTDIYPDTNERFLSLFSNLYGAPHFIKSNLDESALDLSINETVLWDSRFYISIASHHVETTPENKILLDHVGEEYIKTQTQVDPQLERSKFQSTLLLNVQNLLNCGSLDLLNTRFKVRRITSNDFNWLCDQLYIRVKQYEFREPEEEFQFMRSYKNILDYWEYQPAEARNNIPVIEAYITNGSSKQNESIILAVPSLGINLDSPILKIFQIPATNIAENYEFSISRLLE